MASNINVKISVNMSDVEFVKSFNDGMKGKGVEMVIDPVNGFYAACLVNYKIHGESTREEAQRIFERVSGTGAGFIFNGSKDKHLPTFSVSSLSYQTIKEIATFIKELLA